MVMAKIIYISATAMAEVFVIVARWTMAIYLPSAIGVCQLSAKFLIHICTNTESDSSPEKKVRQAMTGCVSAVSWAQLHGLITITSNCLTIYTCRHFAARACVIFAGHMIIVGIFDQLDLRIELKITTQ